MNLLGFPFLLCLNFLLGKENWFHPKIDYSLYIRAGIFISAHFLSRVSEIYTSGLDFLYKYVLWVTQVIFHIENFCKLKHVILSQDIILLNYSAKNRRMIQMHRRVCLFLQVTCALFFFLVNQFTLYVYDIVQCTE